MKDNEMPLRLAATVRTIGRVVAIALLAIGFLIERAIGFGPVFLLGVVVLLICAKLEKMEKRRAIKVGTWLPMREAEQPTAEPVRLPLHSLRWSGYILIAVGLAGVVWQAH